MMERAGGRERGPFVYGIFTFQEFCTSEFRLLGFPQYFIYCVIADLFSKLYSVYGSYRERDNKVQVN